MPKGVGECVCVGGGGGVQIRVHALMRCIILTALLASQWKTRWCMRFDVSDDSCHTSVILSWRYSVCLSLRQFVLTLQCPYDSLS